MSDIDLAQLGREQRLLILHEGLRLKPYRCTAGKLTIGAGRNLDDAGISQAEALGLLTNDLGRVRRGLVAQYQWFPTLSPVRQAVMVDMAFNLGLLGIGGFPKFLHALRQGDWQAAATHMLDSLWARQVGQRATRLAQMVLTDQWPAELPPVS